MDARTEAERVCANWRDNLTPEVREAFHPLVRVMENWHQHLFAYFDHAITNAYTESLNNLILVMTRLGRGYSFEALRAKSSSLRAFTRSSASVNRHRIPALAR